MATWAKMSAVHVLAGLLVLAGCKDQDQQARPLMTTFVQKPGVVSVPGSFPSQSGKYLLKVSINSKNCVEYSVSSVPGGEVVLSNDKASAFSRWFLLWDEADRLWVCSGDIGDCVWVVDSQEKPEHRWLCSVTKADPLLPKMPKAFYDNLGETTQRQYRTFVASMRLAAESQPAWMQPASPSGDVR